MRLQANWNSFLRIRSLGLAGFFALALLAATPATAADEIRPYEKNPFYWQYREEPVLLIGGSWQDNLFNHPDGLREHLDLLKSVGGNYVRNVMSHRNRANVFAFAERDGGFDLERFNEEYWGRLDDFLKLTHERDIIVQLEIWMLADQMDLFSCRPRNDLLSEREPDEAYALAEPGRQYAVYFPEGGAVLLDLSAARGNLRARWLDVANSRWTRDEEHDSDDARLVTPGEGPWAVMIHAAD